MAKKPTKIKLSTEPYKGVRDFYPEDMSLEKYIWRVMSQTAESFGYLEYSASILEPTEIYEAKTGEEIVNNQTYTFRDRGDRKVTLRPEMTPTVARMVAGKRRELSFPLRWYSIPNLFRYERPQKGRLREHYQLNVDIFGVDDLRAEIEIIGVAKAIMNNFGVSDDKFEIRVSSRKILDEYLKKNYNLPDKEIAKVQKLLDKRNKIKDYDEEIRKIIPRGFEVSIIKPEGKLLELINSLNAIGINNIKFDPALVRGFDYYTDIVFEVYDTSGENNRSLFGGGRYDNLSSIFGEEGIPAVGFGMGDVTIRDVLLTYKLSPEYKSPAKLYICVLGEKYLSGAMKLASKLRAEGINTAVDLSLKNVGDQVKYADKNKIPYIVCFGEEEQNNEAYKLKKLSSGEETRLGTTGLITALK